MVVPIKLANRTWRAVFTRFGLAPLPSRPASPAPVASVGVNKFRIGPASVLPRAGARYGLRWNGAGTILGCIQGRYVRAEEG